MIGVILVTHGDLAREFLAATEHIMGAQPYFKTICIDPVDDMEKRRKDILEAIKNVDDGGGVLIITDMFGGTPSNLAISVMDKGKIEVVSGANLPMLVKLVSLRKQKSKILRALVKEICEAGRKYIGDAATVLEEK